MEKIKKILVVFGTRPEAIKMCPLTNLLKKEKCFKVVVCVTGQHKEMLKQVLDIFSIIPDYDLDIMKNNQSLCDISKNILDGFGNVLKNEMPDLVLVHGDTSTAFAASLCCYYNQINVGHVEAGLRTFDIYSPFPEEFNRRAISIISSFNFAPTQVAMNNLLKENVNKSNIYITGNTVFDALELTSMMPNNNEELYKWLGNDRLLLLTAHRRENIGPDMENMFKAINEIVVHNKNIRVIFPLHLNPAVRNLARKHLIHERIKLIEPLNVVDFHDLMRHSYIILTDSGGIQEEACALRKPVLVMRNTTERPEGITANVLKLVGTKKEDIVEFTNKLINDSSLYRSMANGSMPFGMPGASKRIIEIIKNNLK